MSASTSEDCACTHCSYEEMYTSGVKQTTGVKGSDVYTSLGVGDPRIVLNTKLVRGADAMDIRSCFGDVLSRNTEEFYKDAVVMAFQKRDVRGGGGERKLFHLMMEELMAQQPTLAEAVLELVPDYGSWDDMFTMAHENKKLTDLVLAVATKQLLADEKAVAASTPEKPVSISLLGKWAPREDKQFHELAKAWARSLAGPAAATLKQSQMMASYRKRLAKLNAHLKTVETFECANRWDEIDPKRVAARARELKKAAYLNEKLRKAGHGVPELRHPDDEKRMECRKHFQDFFKAAAAGEVKISGAQTLYPHEIVTKAEGIRYNGTEDDKNSLNAVWTQMVAKAAEGGGLGKSLFMCDFSGSMQGIPMQVAKAMGLLGSAVCSGPLKGRFLTFNTTPEWCEIDTAKPLTEQLSQLNFNWGGSTDIQKAGEMILAELKKSRAAPGTAPENLIIVTDMGFDAACGSASASAYTGNTYRHNVKAARRQTHAQMLRENFRRASEDVHGDPNAWPAPRIVVWNVAAQYSNDHQATATEEGVVTLAGWSPCVFKILCEEGPRVVTPWDALRALLDDKRYDPVRTAVQGWLEGGWRGIA